MNSWNDLFILVPHSRRLQAWLITFQHPPFSFAPNPLPSSSLTVSDFSHPPKKDSGQVVAHVLLVIAHYTLFCWFCASLVIPYSPSSPSVNGQALFSCLVVIASCLRRSNPSGSSFSHHHARTYQQDLPRHPTAAMATVNKPVDAKKKEEDVNRKLQFYGIINAFQNGKVPSVRKPPFPPLLPFSHGELNPPTRDSCSPLHFSAE
jgi:hypothetical protein